MTQLHIFGDEIKLPPEPIKARSPYIEFKIRNNYRKSEDKEKRCATCKFQFNQKRWKYFYKKCSKLGVSNSPATDVAYSNVCDLWIKQDDKPTQPIPPTRARTKENQAI